MKKKIKIKTQAFQNKKKMKHLRKRFFCVTFVVVFVEKNKVNKVYLKELKECQRNSFKQK